MLNICSSVQDHNQSLIHRGSGWTNQRAKEFILKPKSIWMKVLLKMISSEAYCVWRKQLLYPRHQKQVHEKQVHQKLLHQKLKSVDKVQCTKCTTTNSAYASATTISASCLLYRTRITVMFADIVPSLLEWIWSCFSIGQLSNRAKDQWWRIKASVKTSWCTS